MKLGRTLEELAREITRQAAQKRDYVAGTENMEMRVVRPAPLDSPDYRVPMLLLGNDLGLDLKPIAHAQIAGHLAIPKPYYDRMLASQPALLADNVKHLVPGQPRQADGAHARRLRPSLSQQRLPASGQC
jgi:hypothetical protein